MRTELYGHIIDYNTPEELSEKLREIRATKIPKHLRKKFGVDVLPQTELASESADLSKDPVDETKGEDESKDSTPKVESDEGTDNMNTETTPGTETDSVNTPASEVNDPEKTLEKTEDVKGKKTGKLK